MEIKMMPIAAIKPYEKNPRKNAKAVPEVKKSLKKFGWRQPLVVDNNMVLIVGHTRLLAAQELKMKEVPVHVADLTEAEAKAYRIMDNRTNEHAEWDFGLLVDEIDGLFKENENFNLDFFGFETKDFDKVIGMKRPSNLSDPLAPSLPPPEPLDEAEEDELEADHFDDEISEGDREEDLPQEPEKQDGESLAETPKARKPPIEESNVKTVQLTFTKESAEEFTVLVEHFQRLLNINNVTDTILEVLRLARESTEEQKA